MPKDVQNPNIPFTKPDEQVEMPFVPPRQFTDIIVQTKRIRMIPRTKPPGEPSKSLKIPRKSESLLCASVLSEIYVIFSQL